jgi:signal transduction histidine kinase
MTARRPALTIRTQLTLVYGVSFAVATTVLSVGVYLLTSTLLATPAVGPSDPPAAGADRVSGLLLTGGVVLACGLLLAGVLGWLVSGRMLAPIRRIATIANETASRNLHARVALAGPQDEVKQLADTFDGMLDRLERGFEAHRRFAANASHELLTPLTTSRAMLEVAAAHPAKCDVRELTGRLLAVNAQSELLVETLLDLARAEHGVVEATPADLAVVAGRAWAEIRSEAVDRELTVEVVSAPAFVDGDPALLDRLAVNLLRNAVRHNHPGGHVRLHIAHGERGPALTVTNTGPEVPAGLLGELFEPFVRATPRTRGGHGLGMAIVRAVAEAHRATVTATANPGGGLTVTIAFPDTERPRKAAPA